MHLFRDLRYLNRKVIMALTITLSFHVKPLKILMAFVTGESFAHDTEVDFFLLPAVRYKRAQINKPKIWLTCSKNTSFI